MFIEYPTDVSKSWVILDQKPLLNNFLGSLYNPNSSPKHNPLSYSTGVVPLTRFEDFVHRVCKNYSAAMLLTFLCRLEHCREIEDKIVLESIIVQERFSETEKYYFFPHLVSLDRPTDKWRNNFKTSYQFGWMIQCAREGDYFSPHFIQALLLRLTFMFTRNVAYDSVDYMHDSDEEEEENQAMAIVIKRGCSVWKSGMYWQGSGGIKTIVDVIDQQKLLLLMQCPRGSEPRLLKQRSHVMSMVLRTKCELCPNVRLMEYYLHPECLGHPMKMIPKEHLFSLPCVERSILDSDSFVYNDTGTSIELRELLFFEPYHELQSDIVKALFHQDSEDFDDRILISVTKQLSHRYDLFANLYKKELSTHIPDDGSQNNYTKLANLFRLKLRYDKNIHYLRKMLNKVSIFKERDPPQGACKISIGRTCLTTNIYFLQLVLSQRDPTQVKMLHLHTRMQVISI